MVSENESKNTYCPDYAVPPGATLLEVIQSKSIKQSELAERMGRPKKTINEIIKGKAEITPETAVQLEHVLGISAKFWLNLEKNYRLDLARIAESKKLEKQKEWLKNFPLNIMKQYGWIEDIKDAVSNITQLFTFFGVASIDAWEHQWNKEIASAMFRKSETYKMNYYALTAWLRKGELAASLISADEFNKQKFKESLKKIRNLTILTPEEFIPEMVKICASCGVLLVFVPELPKVPVHGITRWISTDKVIIQLSLYKKKEDHFWFSFFHEAGHVILHGKRDFVCEAFNKSWDNEADEFASNILIPKQAYDYFLKCNLKQLSSFVIKEFADSLGIATGIIIGRLQHDRYLDFSMLNNLKRTFVWCKN